MFDKVDKTLLVTILILLVSGLIIFGSAALGVLAVNETKFYSVVETQLIYALIGGSLAMFAGIMIPYTWYKKYAYYFFALAAFATSLVFVHFLSRYHGGASRWLDIGPLSVQPSEMLKFSFVLVTAFWCAKYRNSFKNWRYGLLPYAIAVGVVSVLLLAQPDFGTYLVIMISSFVTYFIGGARKNHILSLILVGILGVVILVTIRPYMLERVKTFLNSSHDPRGSSWQLNQSLIALGGGGLTGRGLGQSVQKFNYLPEPIGDSVFAVLGEELGFIGVVFVIILYGIIGARGYIISKNTPDQFGSLLAIGITAILLSQATLNIGSMLGILPLTGVPLPLVSHGGTALMVGLFELGVLLNISKSINHYL